MSGEVGNGVWQAFQVKQPLSWTSKVRVSGPSDPVRLKFPGADSMGCRLGLASQFSEFLLLDSHSLGKILSRLLLLCERRQPDSGDPSRFLGPQKTFLTAAVVDPSLCVECGHPFF